MMKSKIDAYFAAHFDEMLADIRALVAIDSAKGPEGPGMPYGPGCAQALKAAAEMGEAKGFAVRNFDNRVITLDAGEGEPVLGILAHLDVVPAGEGWNYPPFGCVIENGRMYGRGTADDKGAAVAAMYAMCAARELGGLNKGCRLVLGTDEECGSSDLAYYRTQEEMPPQVFSPDADFPVYNTEKGMFSPVFSAKWGEESVLPRITAFASGASAANVVPASARAVILGMDMETAAAKAAEFSKAHDAEIRLHEEGEKLVVEAIGVAAHASIPWDGKNAVTALLAFLAELPLKGSCAEKFRALSALFPFGDNLGTALGIAEEDAVSGKLTVNFSILDADETGFTGRYDSRTPICTDQTLLSEKVKAAFTAHGIAVEKIGMVAAHHTPSDLPFVQTLLRAYETFTGQPGSCHAMGGGTYAHGIAGAVSFGPVFPGVETNLHGIDEYVVLEDLLQAAKIYTLAIMELCA